MKLLLLVVFHFGIAFLGKGQIIESRIKRFSQQEKIDSFLVYSYYLDGSFPLDSCHSEATQYLFWHKDAHWFAKRFDYCQSFLAEELDSLNPLQFYLVHKGVIHKEVVKRPTYYEAVIRKGKKEMVMVMSTGLSHTFLHQFQFFAGGKSKTLYVDEYDLDFKRFDNGRTNINYAFNQKTKLRSLIQTTSKLIKNLKNLVAE